RPLWKEAKDLKVLFSEYAGSISELAFLDETDRARRSRQASRTASTGAPKKTGSPATTGGPPSIKPAAITPPAVDKASTLVDRSRSAPGTPAPPIYTKLIDKARGELR